MPWVRIHHHWSDYKPDCRGRSDGAYMGIYTPKSVQVDFLWGKNDVRMAIEHKY